MTRSDDTGYALDLLSAVRHVATKLDEVRPSGRAFSELVGYQASNGDLSRIKQYELHNEEASDEAATEWLIRKALAELDGRVDDDDGDYTLNKPLDQIRYKRRPLHPFVDEHPEYRDAFNRNSGEFSDNVGIASKRMDKRHGSLDELRDSLRRFGWLRELPGVRDENGVILIGHRRWALADELGISEGDRAMTTITYGRGDEADRKRMIAAVQSNVGNKEFTAEEWKRVARYMRTKGDTIKAIAEALDKPTMTVHDAVGFTEPVNPKRGGRPRNLTDEEQQRLIRKHFEEGKPIHVAESEARGIKRAKPSTGATKVIDQERGRRQEREGTTPGYGGGHPSSDAKGVCQCCGQPLPD